MPLSVCLQVFAFDHCFWSMDESNIPKYAGESLFDTSTQNHFPSLCWMESHLHNNYFWYCNMESSGKNMDTRCALPRVGSEKSSLDHMLVQASLGLVLVILWCSPGEGLAHPC